LIPDLIRSVAAGRPVEIRAPNATRPWQHVLECLSGYLLLGQRLIEGDRSCAEAWNFGPDREGNRPVKEVLSTLKAGWPAIEWETSDQKQLHEAKLLQLDSDKARGELGWKPVWTFQEGVEATATWYRAWLDLGEVISRDQLQSYIRLARDRGCVWARDLPS
jgi:CDP-glucose 4,6-dehydratase